MIQNLEDERDHYKDECQILQEMVKKRLVSKETTKSPSRRGKVHFKIFSSHTFMILFVHDLPLTH